MRYFAAFLMPFLLVLSASAKERKSVVVNPTGDRGRYHNTVTAQIGVCECAANPNSKEYPADKKASVKGKIHFTCVYHCMNSAGEIELVTGSDEQYDKGNNLSCKGIVYGTRGDPWGPQVPNWIQSFNSRLTWSFRATTLPEIKAWSKAVGCRY